MKKFHYQELEKRKIKEIILSYKDKEINILDYGCGNGRYKSIFEKKNIFYTGVDINEDYVCTSGSNYRVIHTDTFEENIKNRRYDVVLLSHIIEHLDFKNFNTLMQCLIDSLSTDGVIIIITPVLNHRFFYDFTHTRPFYPQTIRHAFGQTKEPISIGSSESIEMTDIYFFNDPIKTRLMRSYYINNGLSYKLNRLVNIAFDYLWLWTNGLIGSRASWLGIYKKPTSSE